MSEDAGLPPVLKGKDKAAPSLPRGNIKSSKTNATPFESTSSSGNSFLKTPASLKKEKKNAGKSLVTGSSLQKKEFEIKEIKERMRRELEDYRLKFDAQKNELKKEIDSYRSKMENEKEQWSKVVARKEEEIQKTRNTLSGKDKFVNDRLLEVEDELKTKLSKDHAWVAEEKKNLEKKNNELEARIKEIESGWKKKEQEVRDVREQTLKELKDAEEHLQEEREKTWLKMLKVKEEEINSLKVEISLQDSRIRTLLEKKEIDMKNLEESTKRTIRERLVQINAEKTGILEVLSDREKEIAVLKESFENREKSLLNEVEEAELGGKLALAKFEQEFKEREKNLRAEWVTILKSQFKEKEKEFKDSVQKEKSVLKEREAVFDREKDKLLVLLNSKDGELTNLNAEFKKITENHKKEIENMRQNLMVAARLKEAERDKVKKEYTKIIEGRDKKIDVLTSELRSMVLEKDVEVRSLKQEKNALVEKVSRKDYELSTEVAKKEQQILVIAEKLNRNEKEWYRRLEDQKKQFYVKYSEKDEAVFRKTEEYRKLLNKMKTEEYALLLKEQKYQLIVAQSAEKAKQFKKLLDEQLVARKRLEEEKAREYNRGVERVKVLEITLAKKDDEKLRLEADLQSRSSLLFEKEEKIRELELSLKRLEHEKQIAVEDLARNKLEVSRGRENISVDNAQLIDDHERLLKNLNEKNNLLESLRVSLANYSQENIRLEKEYRSRYADHEKIKSEVEHLRVELAEALKKPAEGELAAQLCSQEATIRSLRETVAKLEEQKNIFESEFQKKEKEKSAGIYEVPGSFTEEFSRKNAEKEDIIINYESRLGQLKEEVEKRDSELNRIKGDIDENLRKLEECNKKIEQLRRDSETASEVLKAKEVDNQRLQVELGGLVSRKEELLKLVEEKDTQLNSINAAVNGKIEAFAEALKAKEKDLEAGKARITELEGLIHNDFETKEKDLKLAINRLQMQMKESVYRFETDLKAEKQKVQSLQAEFALREASFNSQKEKEKEARGQIADMDASIARLKNEAEDNGRRFLADMDKAKAAILAYEQRILEYNIRLKSNELKSSDHELKIEKLDRESSLLAEQYKKEAEEKEKLLKKHDEIDGKLKTLSITLKRLRKRFKFILWLWYPNEPRN